MIVFLIGSMQKIEEEANSAQIQYEAISKNWDYMLSIKDPLDIDAEMKEQKKKCDDLLAQKDSLIAEVKGDLKAKDESYYKDLEKQVCIYRRMKHLNNAKQLSILFSFLLLQDNDIKELSDRIEKQITIMQRAYGKQLSLIEAAVNIEREAMIDHNKKRWEALYKQCDKEEIAHLDYKFVQVDNV